MNLERLRIEDLMLVVRRILVGRRETLVPQGGHIFLVSSICTNFNTLETAVIRLQDDTWELDYSEFLYETRVETVQDLWMNHAHIVEMLEDGRLDAERLYQARKAWMTEDE